MSKPPRKSKHKPNPHQLFKSHKKNEQACQGINVYLNNISQNNDKSLAQEEDKTEGCCMKLASCFHRLICG